MGFRKFLRQDDRVPALDNHSVPNHFVSLVGLGRRGRVDLAGIGELEAIRKPGNGKVTFEIVSGNVDVSVKNSYQES